MSDNTFTCGDRKEQAEINALETSDQEYNQCLGCIQDCEGCAHWASVEDEAGAYAEHLNDEFDKVITGIKPAVCVDDDVPF